jgi:ATP-dependent Clp protease adaptor protein ClpS
MHDEDIAVLDKDEIDIEEPKNYIVILLNDNYTPQVFVTEILKEIFHKDAKTAFEIMMDVHTKGKGIAGSFIYDIALTKQRETIKLARAFGFPLQVTLEEE